MVNVPAVPEQVAPPLVETGVTESVETTAVDPLFTAVKLTISPLPLAARPMVVLLLFQLYVVAEPPNVMAVVLLPAQRI